MHRFNVLVVQPLHAAGLRLLDEREDVSYEVLSDADPDQLLGRVPTADALTIRDAPLPAGVIEAARRLRIVSRHGVGLDNVPLEECTRHGVPVTIVGDVNTVAVAEHAMYLMLAAARAGVELDAGVRTGDFGIRSRRTAVELAGRTLLLIGLGRIAREVARRAAAFGLSVIAHDPFLDGAPPDGVELIDDLDAGLTRAHVVSIHVPLTDTTRDVLGERALGLLPQGAIVVNTARGGLLDEAALLAAVREGRLHGAGLDVFADEPLPATSPLVGEPRIVLSPHSAALTDDALRAMSIVTVTNVLAAFDGVLDPSLVANPDVLAAGRPDGVGQDGAR